MAKETIYNSRRYKTEQKIGKIHDVDYHLIKDRDTFDEALEKLTEKNYVSVTAEKQRTLYYIKKLKISGTKETKIKQFEKVVESFLFSINNTWSLKSLEEDMYQLNDTNMHKFYYDRDTLTFKSWFIVDDIIYYDKFDIEDIDKRKSRLYIEKQMKTPLPMDWMSLIGLMIRREFKVGWNKFLKDIKKGIM